MDNTAMDGFEENASVRMLKHDIKNQLSNIVLALSQLEYEMPETNADQKFYLDTINDSCKKINQLLNEI
ncbi:histidine kinase dimerization/phospho-acceptor domain-containing protein [Mucilaginibacter sp. AW1-3]